MVLDNIRSTLQSTSFIAQHRKSPGDFTRQRTLTFEKIGLFFLQGAADSLKFGMDSLLRGLAGAIHFQSGDSVSKQAISKACQKFPYEALIALHANAVETFYEHHSAPRWMGLRLVGVDGAKMRLSIKKHLAEEFGVQANGGKTERPMGLLVAHYDVLTGIPLSGEFSPCYMGERFLAERLLPHRSEDDLLLYDRGFPSFVMFAMHQSLRTPFCMRLTKNYNPAVEQFIADEVSEREIVMHPNRGNLKECAIAEIPSEPVTVRLVRVRLKSGEVEVLATSLTDPELYPVHLFKDLYAQRWGVEEGFKALKAWAMLESYRTQDTLGIYREVFARLITVTLAAMARTLSQPLVDERTKHRKYRYRVNLLSLLRKLRFQLVSLWCAMADVGTIQTFLQWAANDCSEVRPGRSYPRISRNISALPARKV